MADRAPGSTPETTPKTAPHESSELTALKDRVCSWVDARADDLLEVSHQIHAKPELAFNEHAACDLLVGTLRKAGLVVDTPAGGLDTAFSTTFGRDDGACVALLAEYDALPDIGHACGHNLIATAALGARSTVPTLEKEASLKIPAGTPTGKVFRLKGQGLPRLHGGRRGDQLERVFIDIPTKLSSEQKKLIRKLSDLDHD